MDNAFNDALITSRLLLIRTLDIEAIIPYLMENRILTNEMVEEIRSYNTTQRKTGAFLDTMSRRIWLKNGVPVVRNLFIEALYSTGQSGIGDVLSDKLGIPRKITSVTQSAVATPREPIFGSLSAAINRMKPFENKNDRHGTILLTSTSTFVDKPPISKLGEREIPFMFATKAFGYTIDNVLMWPNAPSKAEFVKSYDVYQQEVSEILDIIKTLEHGGLHVRILINDSRLLRLLRSCIRANNYFTVNPDDTVHVINNNINTSILSQVDTNLMACLIHLICFFDHNFIMRKSDPPKPNCYLLFKVKNWLQRSCVIMQPDHRFIDDAVNLDESVLVPTVIAAACPW